MLSEALLAVTLVSGLPAEAVPIRVGNAQVDALDLSVTYEFVNEAADVTAYEVSITRYFADGSTLVSTQGQDWFSSIGQTAVRPRNRRSFADRRGPNPHPPIELVT